MGSCGSKLTPDEKKAQQRNKKIDKVMKDAESTQQKEVKILLLGAGESGKSTLFKQMKLLQDGQFEENEVDRFKDVVYSNCYTQMKTLCLEANNLGIPIENDETANNIKKLKQFGEIWRPEIADWIKILWKDPGIQATYQQRYKFQLNDSAAYFFDNIDRISKQDYIPSSGDILRARIRTSGIDEADYRISHLQFKMIDVGGQRSERRKWIHCFEQVNCVIFCAALIGYAQRLREDPTSNRMHEALTLFHEVCNSPWFSKSTIVLFLNKKDLFKDILQEHPLSQIFPDYQGGKNEEAGIAFVKSQFEKEYGTTDQSKRKFFSFETCALDTDNINKVFQAIIASIREDLLDNL